MAATIDGHCGSCGSRMLAESFLLAHLVRHKVD